MSGRITDAEVAQLRNHGAALLALAERRIGSSKLKKRGDEHEACCPFHDEKNPSFSVNAKKGVYKCLSCGAEGDTIGFARKIDGLSFIKACELVAQTAGITLEKDKKKTNGNGNGHTKTPDWTPLAPTPETPRPTADEMRHYQLGEPTDVYEYVGRDGHPVFYVRRFDRVGQRKEIRPLSYGVLKQEKGWHDKAYPAPRPLFRLDAVTQAAGRTILLVEGEKAVKAAEQLYPDYVIATWSGGAKAVAYSDFTPLGDGTNVILWPDADEQGIGAMREIAALLPQARWLDVADLPEAFDAADLEEDDPQAWLDARIQKLPEVPKPKPPPDPIHEHELPEIQWKWGRGSDWGGVEVPERLWVLPGWIPRRQTTGLYGEGGVNKTDFLLQLALAYSRGLIFAGHQLEQAPVVCLFCEDEEEEIIRRANRIARHYGFFDVGEFPDFHYVSLVGFDLPYFLRFKNSKPKAQVALKRADKKIVETGARLMILDTAPHFFGGFDLSRLEVSTFLRKLDGISLARDCAVLFAAHPSQSGVKSGKLTAGSTHWEGGVRARISLQRPEPELEDSGKPPSDTKDRLLTLWKSNYAAPGKTIDLVWNDGVFTTAALDPEKAKARGPQANQAAEEKFLDLLRAVRAQGFWVSDMPQVGDQRYAPAVFARHPDGKAFSKPQFKLAMDRLKGAGTLRLDYNKKLRCKELIDTTTIPKENQPKESTETTASENVVDTNVTTTTS